MKKLIASLSIFCLCIPISQAAKNRIPIQTHQRKDKNQNTDRPRAPMQIPVTVSFDDETLLVEVSTPSDLEGHVFLYDAQGNVEDFSPEINTTLQVASPGIHTVVIQGATWTAEGEFEYNL